MAQLRLFANLREMAGAPRLDVHGQTVGEVIAEATTRFGPEFGRGVETSRVWLNGQEARYEMTVGPSDEVVLLPPVSGGNQPSAISSVDLLGFMPLVVAVIAVLANLQTQEIWAATLVAVTAVWAFDLSGAFHGRGRAFAPLAVSTAAAAGVIAAHVLGGTGYALALALAVMITLGWAVAFPTYRSVEVISPTVLVSLVAALGGASLMVVRSSAGVPEAVDVFLAAVIAGAVVGAIVARVPPLPFLDPFTSTAITSVLASVGAAALWDLDVVSYLLVGLGIAVALVAGFGLSSILRSGRAALTERPPGVLVAIDGIALAAAALYPLVSLVF